MPVPAAVIAGPVPVIAGYRVVRRLGSGSRADVYLGHAGERNSTVALKVFRPEAGTGSVEREIQALSATPVGRLPSLVDVAALPDGRACLVLELLSGGSLGRRLAAADLLGPGEAVTILAPIAAALAAVHAAGFAHGRLVPSSVLFDARGRPVLAGLGALRELPPAGSARTGLLREEHSQFAMLVRNVFDRLDPAGEAARRAEELGAWFDGAGAGVPFRPCLDELERRLFGWSPAEAVRLTRPDQGGEAAGQGTRVDGARLRREALRTPEGRAVAGDGRTPGTAPWTPGPAALHILDSGFLDLPALKGLLASWRERLRLRRRPLVVGGLVAAAATVLALTLLPAGDPASRGGAAGDARAPSSASPTGRAAEGPSKAEAGALAADDPVAALPVLLRLRAECLAGASVVCLDDVDQTGSAAMASDSYTVRLLQRGGSRTQALDAACCTLTLVERAGNSALLALAPRAGAAGDSKPASALIIRGEAGWRLREIFDY